MFLKCFASVVFPEHVAPLSCVASDVVGRKKKRRGTYPIPTNITRNFFWLDEFPLLSDILLYSGLSI